MRTAAKRDDMSRLERLKQKLRGVRCSSGPEREARELALVLAISAAIAASLEFKNDTEARRVYHSVINTLANLQKPTQAEMDALAGAMDRLGIGRRRYRRDLKAKIHERVAFWLAGGEMPVFRARAASPPPVDPLPVERITRISHVTTDGRPFTPPRS